MPAEGIPGQEDCARRCRPGGSGRHGFRLDEVASGVIVAQTASGRVEIGVHDGVAAYLDLDTKFGAVRNDLDDAGRPEPDARTVEVHARTSFGDVVVRRSSGTYTLREEA